MSIRDRLAPLAPWNLLRTLDELRELAAVRTRSTEVSRRVRALTKQVDAMSEQMDAVSSELQDTRKALAEQRTLVKQSRAAYQSDSLTGRQLDRALKVIGRVRVRAHVETVVAAAALESDPCPHIVCEPLLPDDAYDELLAAIPPPLFFEHLARKHQDLKVPFVFAPRHSREVWQAFLTIVVANGLIPALTAKFQDGLEALMRAHWPAVDSLDGAGVTLHPIASRVMRRRPGYEIKPHRDPRWAFLTCILYLTQRDDHQLHGTQLCRWRNDRESPSPSPFWVAEDEVEVVRDVPGRPNSAVIFLNSTGVHQASIPADAPPETDRYIYQLQLGPERSVRESLIERLPAEESQRWTMKNADKTFKY